MNSFKENESKVTVYRFDVFKGEVDSSGKVKKIKSIGSAYVREGLSTYTLHLKTFLKDSFYLLQNTRSENPDFVILTRESAQNLNRKYYWNNVGAGTVLDGVNAGIMRLKWDIFSDDLYMTVEPMKVTEIEGSNRETTEQAA